MRTRQIYLLWIVLSFISFSAKAEEVFLDADDVQFLKTLSMRDQYIKDMSKMSDGLTKLIDLFDKTAPAPVKIAIKWQ